MEDNKENRFFLIFGEFLKYTLVLLGSITIFTSISISIKSEFDWRFWLAGEDFTNLITLYEFPLKVLVVFLIVGIFILITKRNSQKYGEVNIPEGLIATIKEYLPDLESDIDEFMELWFKNEKDKWDYSTFSPFIWERLDKLNEVYERLRIEYAENGSVEINSGKYAGYIFDDLKIRKLKYTQTVMTDISYYDYMLQSFNHFAKKTEIYDKFKTDFPSLVLVQNK